MKSLVLYKIRSLQLYKFFLYKFFYKIFRFLQNSLYGDKKIIAITVKYYAHFQQKFFGTKAECSFKETRNNSPKDNSLSVNAPEKILWWSIVHYSIKFVLKVKGLST